MKVVNGNKMSELEILHMRNQAKLAHAMQKIGRGKRKVSISLSKSSQKYLDQMVVELKKQIEATNHSDVSNILSFLNYLYKNVHIEKGQKREKIKTVSVSYEEYDFLVLQIKSVLEEIKKQRSELKWYNFAKKIAFYSAKAQNEVLLNELKNK